MTGPFKKKTPMGSGANDSKARSDKHLGGYAKEGLAPQSGPMGKQDKSYVRHVPDGGMGKHGTSPVGNDYKDIGRATSRTALENTGMADIKEKPMPPSTDALHYRPVTSGGYAYLGHFSNKSVLAKGHNNMSLKAGMSRKKY